MSNILTAPQVDCCISVYGSRSHRITVLDDESQALCDKLFAAMEEIEPRKDGKVRELWVRANRGGIEKYGRYEDLLDEGVVSNYEDFRQMWLEEYPDEIYWYNLTTVEDAKSRYRAVFLGHRMLMEFNAPDKRCGFPFEVTELLDWLLESVEECITEIKAGKYNEDVQKNLPPQHRTGTVSQGALWDAFPDERSDFFGDFSIIDIEEFSRFVGGELPSHPLLKSMTANDFFRYCAIGYAANGYANCDLSPREQYYKNADGRDEGLGELPPEDPDIFMNWLADRTRYGGHPWEVCAGGNSTHIDLFPRRREGGYIMEVAGSSYGRCMEAIKFALALYHAGVPVYIHDGETLLARLLGKEKVGIVPQGVFPRYCSSFFPSEHIIEYINLPVEKKAKIADQCEWQDIPTVQLTESEELL